MTKSFVRYPALLLLLALSGCVASGTYQEKADEATLLAGTIQALEEEYESLLHNQQQLVSEKRELSQNLFETVQKNVDLHQDLLRARADLDRLERVLSARSEETGQAMAEMRQHIDQLEETQRQLEAQNQDLTDQVEKERVAREARVALLKNTYDQLVDKMEEEIQRGEITISDLQGKLTVNMVERILFDSGQADIKPAGLLVLRRVGDILHQVVDKEIRVEGHTDNIPISPRLQQTFATNWELSTARATNVVHFLREQVGIAGERLSACGFSEFRPLADNHTAKGRAQNRRIQIVLVPPDSDVQKVE